MSEVGFIKYEKLDNTYFTFILKNLPSENA